MEKIVLAGGCFWGVEEYYKRLKGIIITKVGYTDNYKKDPTYFDVCNASGHVEACYIEFEESIISFNDVINHFFRIIDPTTLNRQKGDIGIQYRTGIYYYNETQKNITLNYIKEIQKDYKKEIVVEVKEVSDFFEAEDIHQNYLQKNPNGYCHIDFSLANKNELK